jgi:hypothetical protein
MALTDEDAPTVEQQGFCTSCGQPAGTGHFCANCGAAIQTRTSAPVAPPLNSNSTGAGGAIPPPTFTTTTTTPPATPRRNSRGLLIALGALGLVAVAVAVVILTTRGGGSPAKHPKVAAAPSAAAVYRTKLRTALTPLINSNQRMSNALGSVNPSNPNVNSAKNAASSTQTAVATARGAVGALSAPGSERTLSQQVQQALDNENGYVQAVVATLANPRSSQAGQLQTLSTSLQSSLVPIDPVVKSASSSVSGTNSLTSWANGASARQRKAAAKKHHSSSSSSSGSGSSSSSSSSGSSSVSNPYANGENCGGGLYAGPDTSCPFAENVYQAWEEAPGDAATVTAYSPVTDQTYTMNCAPAGAGITCSGGNNASVTW